MTSSVRRAGSLRGVAATSAAIALIMGAFVVFSATAPTAQADPGDAAELYLAPSTPGTAIGTVPSPSPTQLECPSNKVLVGVQAENREDVPVHTANSILVRVNLMCATTTVTPAGAVHTGDITSVSSSTYDQGRGNISTAQCPTGQAVHRMTGSTFVGEGTWRWPSQIQIVCRPMVVTPAGEMRINLDAAATSLAAGTNFNTNGGLQTPPLQCGPGSSGTSPIFVRGVRLQPGGEGFDGFIPSCAVIPRDFGDAPASYGPASHELNAATYLGWSQDPEPAMQSNATATGDDQAAGAASNQPSSDEDGVTFFSPLIATATNSYSVQVIASNKAPETSATLVGWIDFNRNATFEANEGASAHLSAGTPDGTSITLAWTGIADRTVAGSTFARFRISVGAGVTTSTPTGEGAQGEVEDYALQITPPAISHSSLELVKSVSPTTVSAAGQILTYSFTITNSGSTALADVDVSDTDFSGIGPLGLVHCPDSAATVIPGEEVVCEASYSVTQADIDAGQVTNTAVATGSAPDGGAVESPPSSARVEASPTPDISLVKSATPSTVGSFIVGQQITYSFVATNTGNVTLSDVVVSETDFTGAGELSPIVCPDEAAHLAPEAQLTCTATYTLLQADVDAGSLRNAATVTGISPGGAISPVSPPSTVTIPSSAQPGVSVEKTADLTMATQAEQIVTYSFIIDNTGDVTITNPVVNEAVFNGHGPLSPVTCPAAAEALVPGARIACTAKYVVVADDLVSGQPLRNTATVTAVLPDGETVSSAPSTAIVEMSPGLTIHTGGSIDTQGSTELLWAWGMLVVGGAVLAATRIHARKARPRSAYRSAVGAVVVPIQQRTRRDPLSDPGATKLGPLAR